jgi:ribosomal protein S18 acetylase RimI-like enzyme
MPGFATIGLLAVHPDFQRTGISQMLLRESVKRAKKAGYKYLSVDVGVDPYDVSSRRAYEKAGFEPLSLPTVQYYRSL